MKLIFLEKFKELNDLCKVIYDDSTKTRSIGYLKCYKLSDKYLYYRVYMIDEFFQNQGAPVLGYVISDIEPKDFLFWDLIKNELRMENKGKKMLDNEIVFLIAKIEKLPQFLLDTLPKLT